MGRGENILIVDDQDANIRLLKGMLAPQHYALHGALNGEEALKIVAECPPDLILLDIMMPGIDGFEVCRRLKQDPRTRSIPILMVTALNEKSHRVRAMECGADDFLNKPVEKTELVVRVKSLLRIKSYHDELLERYQEISRKNARLGELEKVKDGLTHMIIHDLKSPLGAISLNLELVLTDRSTISAMQEEALENCRGLCDEFNHLIESLIDIHRMEEGQLQLQKEMTDVSELIPDVFRAFRPRTESRNLKLIYQAPDHVPPVPVDRLLIRRVIDNLMMNAIRHTEEGGQIELLVESLSESKGLRMRVRDNGEGLEPEYHERIFEKFEQVGLKQAGVTTGKSGLGLAFCKMALEAHGGKIWVDSKGRGKGCTFSFELPPRD